MSKPTKLRSSATFIEFTHSAVQLFWAYIGVFVHITTDA